MSEKERVESEVEQGSQEQALENQENKENQQDQDNAEEEMINLASMSDEEFDSYLESKESEHQEETSEESDDQGPVDETVNSEEEVSLEKQLEDAQKELGRRSSEIGALRKEVEELKNSFTNKELFKPKTEEEKDLFYENPDVFFQQKQRELESKQIEQKRLKYQHEQIIRNRFENIDDIMPDIKKIVEDRVKQGIYLESEARQFFIDPFDPKYAGDLMQIATDVFYQKELQKRDAIISQYKEGKSKILDDIENKTNRNTGPMFSPTKRTSSKSVNLDLTAEELSVMSDEEFNAYWERKSKL